MHLTFDPDFDSGAWPGPLAARDAAAGEAWVGYSGLLGILETQLGLRGPALSPVQRIAALLPALRKTDGFWSRSAERDPLGTARRLVGWRDLLALAGWNGAGLTPRLAALAGLTRALEPGVPDRLRAVRDRLGGARCDLARLDCFTPPGSLPALWRSLFEALERGGTKLAVVALDEAGAAGDLAASRRAPFRPVGDGSLQLVRAEGVLEAADALAAWLATLAPAERGQTVILGADAVLDRALLARGLPTLGGAGRHRESPRLQLLPLTLALAFGPPDPQRALELLTLPDSPVPAAVRFRLSRALHQTPAVDSDAWREALAQGLGALEEEPRAKASERIELLFQRSVREASLSASNVAERVAMLQRWARGRAAHDADPASWEGLLHQLAIFSALCESAGVERFTGPQLKRFVEEASGAAPAMAPLPHQSGFASVGAPGAVCGPCARVIWWNFERRAAPPPERWPFTPAELAALAEGGVSLQSASELALDASRRWARPHLFAREAVLWICPQRGEDGEPLFPHPLYDEVLSRIPREDQRRAESLLVRPEPRSTRPLEKHTPALLPAPVPQRAWTTDPSRLERRETESPSGAATLLGCSLQWALQYVAHLRGGALGNLKTAEQVLGDTTHALLATLLGEKTKRTPEEAEARAHALFDEEGPRFAAQLFQPGADAQRAEVRRTTGLAARELFRLIAAGGFEVRSVEEAYAANVLGGELEGRPDLVLARGDERAVIDLKWSGLKYRRESLEQGTAHQLASYSRLVGDAKALPANAFFILRNQRLLTTDGAAFPGAQPVEGPGPEETWRAFELAHSETWREVREGRLTATGIAPPEEAMVGIEDGRMRLSPPCGFCNFAAVCGRAFVDGGEA